MTATQCLPTCVDNFIGADSEKQAARLSIAYATTTVQDKPVRPNAKPGYLPELLPGGLDRHLLHSEQSVDPLRFSCPTSQGEDINTIADDYQSLIMPGVMH